MLKYIIISSFLFFCSCQNNIKTLAISDDQKNIETSVNLFFENFKNIDEFTNFKPYLNEINSLESLIVDLKIEQNEKEKLSNPLYIIKNKIDSFELIYLRNLSGLYSWKQKNSGVVTEGLISITRDKITNEFYGSFSFFVNNQPFGTKVWSYGKIYINKNNYPIIVEFLPYLDWSKNESPLHKEIINGKKNPLVFEFSNQNKKLFLKQNQNSETEENNIYNKINSNTDSESNLRFYRKLFKDIN